MKQSKGIPNRYLLQERLLRRWSQREVAAKLDTSFVNVSRWERGITAPGPYFRSQLCALFEKQPQELGLCLDQSAEEQHPTHFPTSQEQNTPPPARTLSWPLWHVPFSRNPFFTGRDSILQFLHQMFKHQRCATALTQSCALHGLGGIGKTQIALEYAYRYASHYTAILWISAETDESLLTGFVSLAEVLNLPEQHEQDQHRIVRAITRWLAEQNEWLLVFDNVKDPALLQPFLPATCQGSILLTTQLQAVGTIAQQITVERLNAEESVAFLLRRAKLLRPGMAPTHLPPTDMLEAQAIVKAMDSLPLALDQAGAYIEETQCSLGDYLQWYRQRRSRFLAVRGQSHQDHPASVQTTVSLSLQQVEQRSPAAKEVLQLCAFLASDGIPEELLTVGFSPDSEYLQSLATAPWFLSETIAVLRTYSLIHRDPITKTLSLHRLVQAVLQDRLSEQEQEEWMKRAITAVNRVFPEVEHEVWNQCERLVPHALQCAKHPMSWEQATEDLATLLFKMGTYLMERGRYQEAELVLRRALQTWEQVLGVEHPDVAYPLNNLGRLYNLQGKYAEAELVLRRAIHIREQALGIEHLLVSNPLNNLGIAYNEQGKYAEAELLLTRALSLREQALGANHPLVAYPLTNLGITHYEQGRYTEAELLLTRALSLREQALEADHPLVAYELTNLGLVYYEQGKYVEAELLLTRAVWVREQRLGADHPQVAYPLTALGKLYSKQGKYQEAELLLMRALHIKEQALGAEHPDCAESQFNLACLFLHQYNALKAQDHYRQALATWEKTLGLAHPQTVSCIEEYAQLGREQPRRKCQN